MKDVELQGHSFVLVNLDILHGGAVQVRYCKEKYFERF